jgi:hypothetical protein
MSLVMQNVLPLKATYHRKALVKALEVTDHAAPPGDIPLDATHISLDIRQPVAKTVEMVFLKLNI